MSDKQSISAANITPGTVIYQKVNNNSGTISAEIRLLKTANVNIRSETGAQSSGGNGQATHTLTVDGIQRDQVADTTGFNAWNGVVETVMVFESDKWYTITANQWNVNAGVINTDLRVTIVMV